MKCCGVHNSTDYPEKMHNELPSSCCDLKHEKDKKDIKFCKTKNSYKGCDPKIQEFIKNHSKPITMVVILFGVIEVNLISFQVWVYFSSVFFADCRAGIFLCVVCSATRWIRFSLINRMIHPRFNRKFRDQINLSVSNSFDYSRIDYSIWLH